jgi:O-antigen/teichoic acid export membrane protein
VLVPSALLVAAYLARRLGPQGYGVYAIASAVTAWLEWSLAALVSRGTIALAAGAGDARPVAATLSRVCAGLGATAGALLALTTPHVAGALGEPRLVPALLLSALELPLFLLAQAHRGLLVGTGHPMLQARAAAARSGVRLLATLVLVEHGAGVPGAVLASSLGILASLVVTSRRQPPSLLFAAGVPVRALFATFAPLALLSIGMRLFDVLDLLLLKALGAPVAEAGLYAAARTLAVAPGLLTIAFSPSLLGALTRQVAAGDRSGAADTARHALRFALALLPLGALLAGSASEVMRLVYGPGFETAGPWLALLLAGSIAMCVVSVGSAILTAAGHALLALGLLAPLLPLAIAGQLLLIPRLGPLGAALVSASIAILGALALLVAAPRVFGSPVPLAGLLRSAGVALLVFGLSAAWPTPGALVLVKLLILLVLVALLYRAQGEIGVREIGLLRSLIPGAPGRGATAAADPGPR